MTASSPWGERADGEDRTLRDVSDRADKARPRVLVLGGGFAGIGAAQKLHKSDVDVVVVDKND